MNPVAAVESTRSAKKKESSKAEDPLYRALDFVMVRAPLLPVKSYFDLADHERQLSLLADARVRRALAVGSPSLLDALERYTRSGLSKRDADRMRAKILRYLIRMSTRPTPFGLFAGVALSTWGPATDLSVLSTCSRMRTRPDMAWLMDLVVSTEANPAVRKQLKLVANPLAMVEAGRVFLAQQAPKGKNAMAAPVSVRATGVVKQALLLARQPIAHAELVAELCKRSSSATPAKVEKLLTELWEQTFLLTDLRPPLTTDSPARYVEERLSSIPEAADSLKKLKEFLEAAISWDALEAKESDQVFRRLLEEAGSEVDGPEQTPVQVDMAIALEGRLGKAVAEEAVRAAELLLRLSPFPHGLASLAGYRQAFMNRYGPDREVALLELLDPNRGLGPMFGHGHAPVGPDPAQAARRSQTLMHLACTAMHERQRVVTLDENCLKRLETCTPKTDFAPLSLDINFLVGARSAVAIDSGDFTFVIGPNLGAQAAGRNLGRFSDLLPEGPVALKQAALADEQHTPNQIWAEFVYLPGNIRSANVVIRPSVRSYEIAVGISAGVPPANIIPLDELMVGIQHGSFYVRWTKLDKRVIFSSGHMLNYRHAPPVGQFLMDLMFDGKIVFSSFDWGPAEGFPYLPRVQVGRIVLRPAEWRIHKNDFLAKKPEDYRRALTEWRARWDVPQHVCVSFGDNRLVLDLEQDAQVAELAAELRKLPENGAIVVQEVVPVLEDSWLAGTEGQYYTEFIASLSLSPTKIPPQSDDNKAERDGAPSLTAAPVTVMQPTVTDQVPRRQPPGSEWLFVKLYCARDLEDDVISESMRLFAENVVASGIADSWFFIRYADPESHIRLRFHGSPRRLTTQLFGHVCDWAANLMSSGLCLKLAFDTYEQEIERFGGPSGMAVAEKIFFADSRSAAALLQCLRTKLWPHDQTALLILSIDDLLSALGFDENERLSWYEKQTTTGGPDVGSEYRQRKTLLRSLLGQGIQFLQSQPGGPEIASVLAARREALSPVATELRELGTNKAVSQSPEVLAASFVHLHLNRMASLDPSIEQRFLSLLLRARESLKKAPMV